MDTADFIHLCRRGTPRELQSALAGGAEVNTRDEYGQTALMSATASSLNLEVISALVKAGAHVDTRDKDGRTALMIAVTDSRKEHFCSAPWLARLFSGCKSHPELSLQPAATEAVVEVTKRVKPSV